jgi:hypothetical protein
MKTAYCSFQTTFDLKVWLFLKGSWRFIEAAQIAVISE